MLNLTTKFMAAALLFSASSAVFAHTGHDTSSFTAGFMHSFFGLDHLLAMVAVGLWAAQSGGKKMWLLPATFMAALAAGAAFSLQGHLLPLVETGIALSVLALGLLIALSLKLPITQGMALTALFGLLHGYAHGAELPASATPTVYALGFLAATSMLHLAGITAGAAIRQRYAVLPKITGGILAMCGMGLLTLS